MRLVREPFQETRDLGIAAQCFSQGRAGEFGICEARMDGPVTDRMHRHGLTTAAAFRLRMMPLDTLSERAIAQPAQRLDLVQPVALPVFTRHGSVVPGPVKDWLSFVERMARNPRAIGAISPASPALAEAMAREVDFAAPGRVLELGPGTGAVTRALIRRGLGPERVLAVEADPTFARILRSRFPGLAVIEGDATDAQRVEALGPFVGIISSLPLLNFPPHERAALVLALLRLLPPGAPFVQYSYGVRPPLPRSPELRVSLANKVWRNLPPARVWVFRTRADHVIKKEPALAG